MKTPLPFVGLAFVAGCATLAQERGDTPLVHPRATVPHHRLEVRVENDSIGLGDTTDKGYTNGIALEYDLPTAWTPSFVKDLADFLPFGPDEVRGPALSIVFGQEMYSPEDITQPALIPDDRPYAGWLFGGLRVRNLNYGGDDRRDRLDTWGLDLGVVGPGSQADHTQIQWHEIIDSPEPRGWANQLQDEFGIILAYERQLRAVFEPGWAGPVDVDVLARVGGQLGNVHTRATVGGTVRLGLNLPRDFGTGIVTEDLRLRTSECHVYVLAGIDGHFVLHNIFLDGNTIRDSHSVDKTLFVADFTLGLEVAFSQRARISYIHVFRTPEFDSPTASARPQDFASIRMTVSL